MKVAVLFPSGDELLSKVAKSVASGAQQAGAEVVLSPPQDAPDLSYCEIVFLGISAYGLSRRMEALSLVERSPASAAKEYRVFCVHSGSGKSALEQARAVLESKQSVLAATLLVEAKGFLKYFGKGKVGEGELARAAAFGERGASSVLGARARPQNEKTRIPGYRK